MLTSAWASWPPDTGSIEVFLPFPSPQPTCLTYLLHLVIFWLVTSLYAKTHGSYYSNISSCFNIWNDAGVALRSTGIRGGREPAPGFWASSISENGDGGLGFLETETPVSSL